MQKKPQILSRSVSLKSALRLGPYFLVMVLCLFSRSALQVGLSESNFYRTEQLPAKAGSGPGLTSPFDIGKPDNRFDLFGKGAVVTNQQFPFADDGSNIHEQTTGSADGLWNNVKESEIATNEPACRCSEGLPHINSEPREAERNPGWRTIGIQQQRRATHSANVAVCRWNLSNLSCS